MCKPTSARWGPRILGVVCALAILSAAIVTTVVLLTNRTTKSVDGQDSSGRPTDSQVTSTQDPNDIDSSEPHNLQYEHVAHAVPGREYTETDFDGDGLQIVQLDASRSHSHYYDPGPPSRLAKITKWTWDIGDRKAVSFSSTPDLLFPVGNTIVTLTVQDDFGNTHTDTTNVTVRSHLNSGAYCYYYDSVGDAGTFSMDDNRFVGLKPIFGEQLEQLDFNNRNQFPDEIKGKPFQVRCTFHLQGDGGPTEFQIQHDGPMRLMAERPDGIYPIIDETENGLHTSKAEFSVKQGLELIQLMYIVPSTDSPAKLKLIQPDNVYHDLATQLPLIHSIDPPNSTLKAGGLVTVKGTGLWNDPQVYFGTNPVTPDEFRSTHEKLLAVIPATTKQGEIEVTVGNKLGGSNALPFLYSNDAYAPIRFDEVRVKNEKNQIFKIKLITNIIFGPDLRLYMASLDSFVHSVAIDRNLKASDLCTSQSLGDFRTVVGLTFNPARAAEDDALLLYASTSIFFWGQNEKIKMDRPWANGMIHKLLPGHNDECLGIVGEPLITGLPVSNHDHGVNDMMFMDDGRMLIQVGGATNAGVPADTVGGIDESPLSGACLVADVTDPDFDGDIEYDDDNPGVAKQIKGDVSVYSPGWRNSFGVTQHTNGFIYATDNGANSEFGNWSTSCTMDATISPYHSDDKLGKVVKGRYGGHPNRNRARDDPEQCVWHNPFEEASGNFVPPMGTFESSTDGIIEYTADLFDGQLKGNLLLSKFSTNDEENDGRVYRVKLDGKGELEGEIESLWEASGLSIAMTVWGDLLMPRLYDDEIMGLKALYEKREVGALTSIWPNRGPLNGGNEVLVVGERFPKGSTARIGGKSCTSTRKFEKDDGQGSFWCTIPKGKAGGVRVDVVLPDGRIVENSGGLDYRYMRI